MKNFLYNNQYSIKAMLVIISASFITAGFNLDKQTVMFVFIMLLIGETQDLINTKGKQ